MLNSNEKGCPKCGFSYGWNPERRTCRHCFWKDKDMKAAKVAKKKVEVSAIPTVTVEEGSGGKLVPRPPCVTMKMMREAAELADKGLMPEGIAAHMEKSVGWVKGSLLIVKNLPDKVHKMIEDHRLSRIAALQLLLCPAERLEGVLESLQKLSDTEGKL